MSKNEVRFSFHCAQQMVVRWVCGGHWARATLYWFTFRRQRQRQQPQQQGQKQQSGWLTKLSSPPPWKTPSLPPSPQLLRPMPPNPHPQLCLLDPWMHHPRCHPRRHPRRLQRRHPRRIYFVPPEHHTPPHVALAVAGDVHHTKAVRTPRLHVKGRRW